MRVDNTVKTVFVVSVLVCGLLVGTGRSWGEELEVEVESGEDSANAVSVGVGGCDSVWCGEFGEDAGVASGAECNVAAAAALECGVLEAQDAEPEIVEVRATAYTHTEADHLPYADKTAVGTRLRYGKVRSAAADWSRFPVGTRFRIVGEPDDHEYVIEDYGSALVGKNTVDLYKPTRSAMNRWGAKQVRIEIVEWGSVERSLAILKPRVEKSSAVRRMVSELICRAESDGERADKDPGSRG